MAKRIIKISLAVLLLIVLTASILCAILTNNFRDWNPYCLKRLGGHKYGDDGICVRCGAERVEKPSEDDKTIPGGAVVTVPEQGGEFRLMAAPMSATEAVSPEEAANSWIIEVVDVTPDYADIKEFDWDIRWVNAQSEWAQDKVVTDYCTLTVDSSTRKVTLRNLKDFGEQIEVVATSRDKAKLTKKALLDYVQKIKGFTFNMSDLVEGANTFTYEVDSTEYTIASEISYTVSNTIKLLDSIKYYIAQYFNDYSQEISKDFCEYVRYFDAKLTTDYNLKTITVSRADNFPDYLQGFYFNGLAGCFITVDDNREYDGFVDFFRDTYGSDPIYSLFRDAVRDSVTKKNNHVSFDVSYKATYNGIDYSAGTKTVEICIDGDALYVPVGDFTLSTDHVIM